MYCTLKASRPAAFVEVKVKVFFKPLVQLFTTYVAVLSQPLLNSWAVHARCFVQLRRTQGLSFFRERRLRKELAGIHPQGFRQVLDDRSRGHKVPVLNPVQGITRNRRLGG